MGRIQGCLRQTAVQAGDSALLLHLLEALDLGLELVNDLLARYLVDLVEVANAPLHNLDKDERLDDGVAGGTDD